jgi:hypothetical protein
MTDMVMAPVHPGEILLEEFLKPLAVSQYKLAKEIGAPPPLASGMWANRLLRVTALSAGPWNESWNEATSAACNQCNASTETGYPCRQRAQCGRPCLWQGEGLRFDSVRGLRKPPGQAWVTDHVRRLQDHLIVN